MLKGITLLFLFSLLISKAIASDIHIPIWLNLTKQTPVTSISVSITNLKDNPVWSQLINESKILYDEEKNCFIQDSILSFGEKNHQYKIGIVYELKNHNPDTCFFNISASDTLPKISLELYFDEYNLIDSGKYSFYYESQKPNLSLIVKYSDNFTHDVAFTTGKFQLNRGILRPEYILTNYSNDTVKSVDKIFGDFFGVTFKLGVEGIWEEYPFAGRCGTYGYNGYLLPFESFQSIEGYNIGSPLKLLPGFYRYSVKYLIHNDENQLVTYFEVLKSTK